MLSWVRGYTAPELARLNESETGKRYADALGGVAFVTGNTLVHKPSERCP
jgi:hypothetical protein